MSTLSDVEVFAHEGLEVATAKEEPKSEKAESASDEKSSDETASESETLEASNEDDQDGSSESEDESESKDEDGQPKKKNGFKKRLNKLTRQKAEAQAQAEYWKAQALKGQSPTETKPAQDTANLQPKAGEPNPDDFDSHAKYVAALVRYEAKQVEIERERVAKADQIKSEQAKRSENLTKAIESFKASHDDFSDLMEDVDDIPISQTVQDSILESDSGAALMYELAKNRDEYAAICKMSPLQAARAIGKIEARIAQSSDEPKAEIKKTKAPPPVSPVKGKSAPVSKSYDDMDYDEFKTKRHEELARR